MPVLHFSTQALDRPDYRLPEATLINLIAEKTPQGPEAVTLLPRPSLKRRFRLAASPVRGIFQASGAFNSATFIAAGNQLYNRAVVLTGVTGSVSNIGNDFGPVRFACSPDQLVIVSAGKAFCYSNVAGVFGVRLITDADLPEVSDVVYLAGRFYYVEKDTDTVWFSALADATSIDGLAFQAAEASPDPIVGLCVLGAEIYAFGVDTTEVFAQTGDADAPLISAEGRRWDKGAAAQAAICNHDNTIYFLGSDRVVYRADSVPVRVSTSGIEERLRKSTEEGAIGTATAFSALHDGHAYFVLNIPSYGTFAFDAQTQQWSEWLSFGEDRFRIAYGVTNNIGPNGSVWLGDFSGNHGDDYSGWIYKLDSESYTDQNDPIMRVATCAHIMPSGVETCFNAMFNGSRGEGSDLQPNPTVELRYSDDKARTWSDWLPRSMGAEGAYDEKAIWRRLGFMRSPGRVFQVRCSDPNVSVFESLTINEARP